MVLVLYVISVHLESDPSHSEADFDDGTRSDSCVPDANGRPRFARAATLQTLITPPLETLRDPLETCHLSTSSPPRSLSSMPQTSSREKGGVCSCLYVTKAKANAVKKTLRDEHKIHKDFRIAESSSPNFPNCMAVPVLENIEIPPDLVSFILGKESQWCLFSTSVLGSHTPRNPHVASSSSQQPSAKETLLQVAIRQTAIQHTLREEHDIMSLITSLSIASCPRHVELLGDDRTVVMDRHALNPDCDDVRNFLEVLGIDNEEQRREFYETLWKTLAELHQSRRVVRKGIVDPESKIRESNYRLLWPYTGIPGTTGPGSPGWITVTEQGIRQSFDLTRVMFSRGNITEKIRFGQLVQPGEIVLDLYAGIGYFTLPALVHGEAAFLYACEWNPRAVDALLFNLRDNQVDERAVVFQGDCRKIVEEQNIQDKVDRVSLGLLPSSEGGWKSAVQALRSRTGGWLHVHANVLMKEVDHWALWLCGRLREHAQSLGRDEWCVVCTHVEKVKSFAPTVCHFVADVFVGPPDVIRDIGLFPSGCAVSMRSGTWVKFPEDGLEVPSCALSSNGPLHQAWMRE